jgi:hypothetical protein
MSPQKAGIIATFGALIGLGIGAGALLSPDSLSGLCTEAPECMAAMETAQWGIPAGTWIAALFLGLTWASASLAFGRPGYTQSGKSLLFAGGLGALFLVFTLDVTEFKPGQLSLAGAVIVGLGGLLGRQKNEDPDRSTGAILACMTLVLLTAGSIAQSKAITEPWSDLESPPTLTGKEAVLDGSATSPNKVLLWADFSSPAAIEALSELKGLNKRYNNPLRVFFKPLALKEGMPIAMGFFCAKKIGRSPQFSEKMLEIKSGLKTDQAVTALALRSQFKSTEFETCFQDETARKKLAADSLQAEKSGFSPPFAILAEGADGWKQLSLKAGLSSQILAIFKIQTEGQ